MPEIDPDIRLQTSDIRLKEDIKGTVRVNFLYGKDMFKLIDRNEKDFCLGPIHEEMITTIAAADIYSYKDFPVNLYQIQVKFRDEIRPRYGLMREREFIMKDAYSFAASEEQLERDYEAMYKAYSRIIVKNLLKK